MPTIAADKVVNSGTAGTKRIHVAVGVIRNDRQEVLIAKRAEHLHQGGLWEFPGGKVEPDETVQDALRRELSEELGITVEKVSPLIQISHDYADKSVLLDVWLVEKFSGVAKGRQSQPLQWVGVSDLNNYSVPSANKSIITALRLPRKMMITGNWLDAMDFEKRLLNALHSGVKLVQLRAHQCDEPEFYSLFKQAKKYCDEYSALLIANTSADHFQKLDADGLHLTSIELMKCKHRPVQKNIFLGASCHSLEQIQQAQQVEVDYITLGAVYKTSTHPDARPMGVQMFARLTRQYGGVVFALGGVKTEMLSEIKSVGAYGIASISEWW